MTCKDCIHYDVCEITLTDESFTDDTPQELRDIFYPKGCKHFRNKADYAEVKHGKWIVKEFGLTHCKTVSCSICGYWENKGPAWNISCGSHQYCPHCGAKMGVTDTNVGCK